MWRHTSQKTRKNAPRTASVCCQHSEEATTARLNMLAYINGYMHVRRIATLSGTCHFTCGCYSKGLRLRAGAGGHAFLLTILYLQFSSLKRRWNAVACRWGMQETVNVTTSSTSRVQDVFASRARLILGLREILLDVPIYCQWGCSQHIFPFPTKPISINLCSI